MAETDTISGMGRKKSSGKNSGSGGPHKTPRTSVQVPDEWLKIARARANANRQPVLWYFLGLIQADAREAGVADLPSLPWEKEADDE